MTEEKRVGSGGGWGGFRVDRVGYDDAGGLDEIVGTGPFHLEVLDDNCVWIGLGDSSIWISTPGRKLAIHTELARIPSTPSYAVTPSPSHPIHSEGDAEGWGVPV